MVFNRGKKLGVGGAVAALLVAGGVYTSTAFAQSASPPASGSASGQQAFVNHLASRLGISDTSKVQQALKDAAKDSVADQVTAGKITQAQAAQIGQRIDSGRGPGGFGFGARPGGPGPKPGPNGKPGGPRGGFGGGQILNAAAGALNMTPDALRQQLQLGKSLKDVAGSNWSSVQAAITTAAKAQLDPLVSSGKMTSTREQDIINRLASGNFPRGRGPRPSGSASPNSTTR